MVEALNPIDRGDQGLQVLHLNVVEVLAHLVFNHLHRFIFGDLSDAISLFTLLKDVLRLRSDVILIDLNAHSADLFVDLLHYVHRLRSEGYLFFRIRILRDILNS